MHSRKIGPLRLNYPPGEAETAGWIGEACALSLQIVQESWGLGPPQDCRIYVMRSGPGFFFQSAPWAWRLLLGATIPFWLPRVRRTWPICAAWTQRYGRRTAIGVKPLRLLAQDDQSNGERQRAGKRIFVDEPDPGQQVQNVTCHELVHACSAHLRLPPWLNEGIAIFSVDRFQGQPTVQPGSLACLRDYTPKAPPPTYRELSWMGLEAIAYHSVRGYWLVRYLEATREGLLKRLFALHRDGKAIEGAVLGDLGMQPERFWSEIDGLVAGYFEGL